MASEIAAHSPLPAPQVSQSLVARPSAGNNAEIRESGRGVRQAEDRHQSAEQQVRRAHRQKQKALEGLRQARADEQKAEQQLREARTQRMQAVSSSRSGPRGTVINVLL